MRDRYDVEPPCARLAVLGVEPSIARRHAVAKLIERPIVPIVPKRALQSERERGLASAGSAVQ